MSAVCWKCVDDQYLKKIIREKGEVQECSECHNSTRKASTAYDLAELADPIFREHFHHGGQVPQWGEGDSPWYEQAGDPLSFHIQEVLGQSFSFDDEIVKALIKNDGAWPPDGEEPFFSDEVNYVSTRIRASELYARWHFVEEDLKHNKRFFSSAAKELFEYLFRDVETRKYWDASENKPMTVVRELPEGSELFRARICHSPADIKDTLSNPYKNVGPPPPARARAGRMNVDGVAVFYGALDSDTCLAELRPAIGGEAAVIRVRTTRPLRLLDFTKIKDSYHVLSYFQPDFNEQVEKNGFLRHLENLISQPVRPGQESDYLITQTMAEYLAHVHGEKSEGKLFQSQPFDGLLFKSVQKTGGTNVVLFPKPKGETDNAFPLAYVDDSVTFFRTMTIEYKHHDMRLGLMEDGEIVQSSDGNEFDDEDE
jgi:hypothetical protein